MKQHWPSIGLLPLLLFALTMLTVGTAGADQTWIDQFSNTLSFYQQHDPQPDWQPYLDKVAAMRAGIVRHDQAAVQTAENDLLRMLSRHAYGINKDAADDLYQMMVSRDIEPLHTVPLSVPDGSINTPYEGGPPCVRGGCDYWRDNVFEAGGG